MHIDSHYRLPGARFVFGTVTVLYALVALLAPVLHAQEDMGELRAYAAAAESAHPGDPAPSFPQAHHALECLICHSAGVPPTLAELPPLLAPPAEPELRLRAERSLPRSDRGISCPARAPPFV